MKKVFSTTLMLSLVIYISFIGFPKKAEAAIAVNASTPARITITHNGATSIAFTGTTASFTPPSGSVLVACIAADSIDGAQTETLAMSNSGTALTWQTARERQPTESSQAGYSAIAYAVVPTGASMTVTASITNHGLQDDTPKDRGSMKVYVFTGVDTSVAIGNSTEGNSTTNNLTTGAFTSTSASSYGLVCGTEWNALGNPASIDTTNDPFTTSSGTISGLSGYKTISSSGASITFNLDASGSAAAAWNWTSAEIMPAAAGSATSHTTKVQNGKIKVINGKIKLNGI